MIEFFAKLIGFRQVVRGQTPFHQADKIQQDLAREKRLEAKERDRERLRDEMKKREEPSEAKILGPSGSEKPSS